MAGLNLLSDNYYMAGSKSLTTGTENAQFPLTNLDNHSPSVKFRSTGNTVVIEIDLLQTRNIDTLAMACDPTEIFGITSATFKTAVTNDFSGSPVYNFTVYPEQNMALAYITEVDHRFVEITLTGQGSYVELGHIFIGARTHIEQNNLSISSFGYGYRDNSDIETNEYGQKFINEKNLQKTLRGTLEFCIKSEQETLDEIFIKHGEHEPLWLIVDKDGNAINGGESKLSLYGHFSSVPEWSAAGGQTYNATLEVLEAI